MSASTKPPESSARRSLSVQLGARLLPLAVLAFIVISTATPMVFFLLRVREIRLQGAATARRIAELLEREAQYSPALWRYNTPKIVEHLRVHQQHIGAGFILVVDREGRLISPSRLPPGSRKENLLWSATPVRLQNVSVGRVWVATSARRLGGPVFLFFGSLGMVLALLMYWIPLRTVRLAEAKILDLVDELERSQVALTELNRGLEDSVAQRSIELREALDDLRAKELRLRELSGRALAGSETERRDIARELHDVMGQALTAIRINVQLMEQRSTGDAFVRERAKQTLELVDETLGEVRRAVHRLGPAIVDDIGLLPALDRACDDLAERTGVAVTRQLSAEIGRFPTSVENACYRILQEALTNVARHASARHVTVSLTPAEPQCVRLEVFDDGQGFDVGSEVEGRGLVGIRERVELLGGTLDIDSGLGHGTRLTATLPIPAQGTDPSGA